MPAAVLVLLTFGAISVDASIAFLAERAVVNAADAAANDAATAIDVDRYRATGDVVIDCPRAIAIAEESFTRRLADWLDAPSVVVSSCTGSAVTVDVRATASFVFARALPGARDDTSVSATGSASAVRR